MNNVFSRNVSWFGFYQPGGMFQEAEYFTDDRTGEVFMRQRDGCICLRVESDLFSPWGWQSISIFKLPPARYRHSITKEEAMKAPDGWTPREWPETSVSDGQATRTGLNGPGEDAPEGYPMPKERRWVWSWPL